MAHVGKLYPYLFERDLSTWENDVRTKLPKVFRLTTGGGFGIRMGGWRFKVTDTLEGVADYSDGSVTYDVINPSGTNPATSMQLRYFLTFTTLLWSGSVKIVDEVGGIQTAPIDRFISNPKTIVGPTFQWGIIVDPFYSIFATGTFRAKTWAQF